MTSDHDTPDLAAQQRSALPLEIIEGRSGPMPEKLRAAIASPDEPVRSLYIHVPFCAHRCHYCDFYSIVDTRDRAAAFVDRLIEDLIAQAPAARGRPLDTIFIGGGTPTLLPVPLWDRLIQALEQHFDLSAIRSGRGEWTVECNPETATPELFACLRAGGVNRLSMGAQSFLPHLLEALDRRHDPANVYRAIDLARQAGIDRVSVDLIFAIPGQSLEEWHTDLATAIELGTTHISAYALTYEPNTPLTVRLQRGDFEPAPDDLETEMFVHAGHQLAAHGLQRYEVSNFARPGDECRHNLAYWRQQPWLACGPSASGHVLERTEAGPASHRWKNTPRLDTYLQHSVGGFGPVIDHEPPDAPRLLAEVIMTGLRLREGIRRDHILERAAALGCEAAILAAARPHEDRGDLAHAGDDWKLTDSGLLRADAIASDLMAAIG